jgi:gliding motility-associated-like protein
MKQLFALILLLTTPLLFSQNTTKKETKNIKIEDSNGNLITDSIQIANFLVKRNTEIDANSKLRFRATLNPVHLCSNNNFEEFENNSGTNVLKNFLYTTENPINPTQCATPNTTANQEITQYNPSQTNLMASTVNATHIDEFIGNINAFDQFALKINYKNSSPTSGVVQAKRFKTNNETNVIFNYKVVLQSITGNDHNNEQPFFKARIKNSNGNVVSEFCVIGDPTNCIFTQAPGFDAGSIVLYTPNWQAGSLDISAIPNNEEFTIEFTAARCGLNGHFGYAYVDDLCLNRSNENTQGSIELNPLYQVCPQLPIDVCGTFTIPNSGGISANVASITLKVYDNSGNVIYTSTTPSSLNLNTKTFCFQLTAANLVNVTTGNYNVGVTIAYSINQTNCTGTNFNTASDNDANPGWDISFLNCTPNCNFTLQTGALKACDNNADGKEFFNLPLVNSQIIGTQTGLTLSYFTNYNDAFGNTNPIVNFTNYESYTGTIYARIIQDATCFKIITFQLVVKNPSATISGILNVCSGSTILKASPGVSYLWSTGAVTQDATVTSIGTYTVTITDSDGCISSASVTILPSTVAVSPTIEVIQPTCFTSTGTITITSPAAEYSYDNGATWTTNAQMTNLGIGTYDVKIRTINNCYSYSTPINIVSYLSDYPLYTFVNPTNCNALGSITITTVASQYSFDDGVTWTTNNTATNLPIGTYKIRTKDAFGCISNFNSIVFDSEFLAAPLHTSIAPYCSNLGSITITTPASEYSFDGGTTWQTSNTMNNLTSGSYLIKIKNAQGCTSPYVYVYLVNFEYSYPNYTVDPAGCDKYASVTITTPGDFYSFDGGITWSTSNTITNLVGGENLQLKVRIGLNCETYNQSVYISSSYKPLPVVANFTTLICDNQNNNNENTDLSSFNSFHIANPNNYTFTYYNTQNGALTQNALDRINNFSTYNLNVVNKIIYVVVTDNFGCSSIANLDLTLIATPVINLEEKYYLCEGYTVTLTESNLFDSYTWSTGETTPSITVSQPGNYSLTVTETHGSIICSTTEVVPVILSNPAVITKFITQDWTANNNVITVNVTGLGDYEYSLNNIDYQDSNVFYDLDLGEYTIYVRDKHGCGTVSDDIYLLMHPKFFTPDGDGYNDYWKIKFSENEPNLTIKIFDRQGKLLKQLGTNSIGWDGKYLGIDVPSTDYWFVVTRENGKELKGHFSLKR